MRYTVGGFPFVAHIIALEHHSAHTHSPFTIISTPFDTDVSIFIHHTYQQEYLTYLATKLEIGWYTHNRSDLPAPNCTIYHIGTIHSLTIHQTHIGTQHLYKLINRNP